MKRRGFYFLVALLAAFGLAPMARTQTEEKTNSVPEVDASELNRQLRERQAKINSLSPEEQESLRAARERALSDPAVKAARAKRDQALREFQAALLTSLLKSDPAVAPVIRKMKAGVGRGY
jgi:hypothetical protein